ncbi:MAG: GNAT family N-acyltransferase [Candidatus Cloacimonadaceae bacterium]|nr:GNAT family N-acetyltransferase [Candidatus Cloacimonadota bacterium]MCB5255269.1 GNAT family N-acetyltransferase [Candidatus Cloacimonadota bacterium]MCK9177977.1 GNAT family N-acetyltransferase [Candidatus Cloacimonadota bacterium]MCK9243123.1 GNAT family N-acetyltransferase [Candidatus Cloacimonadota bacterium]MDD3534268.1 GNAT family N-acetyltransferase [Candidatus Cloacimonadota bacterium]
MNPKTNIAAIINILGKSRMKNFSAHIPIRIEKKNFIVKTADSREELYTALKLRHDIFLDELLKKRRRSGLDKDRFDKLCDHLIIIDKRTNKMIGTYRLQSSLFTKKWYTAKEFHMKHIKKLPGTKLELGRACVHPDFRNGVTIALLWEGITAYIEASDTNYLFGCSSIKTIDRAEINKIYQYLNQHGHLSHEFRVRPKRKFQVPGMKRQLRTRPPQEILTTVQIKDMIPSLLASYLKVGAKVHGSPALDKNFKCIDFLTLLDVSSMQKQRIRKPRDS